jgi:hypothetical protein
MIIFKTLSDLQKYGKIERSLTDTKKLKMNATKLRIMIRN